MSGIFRRLFRRSSFDEEVREEIESHIAMRAALNRRSGMPPDEALRAARRQFGNPTSIRERLYDFNGFGWLDTVAGDLVYAFRGLRRNLGLSLTVVLTIALAVGAAAVMFSVMQNLMLAPPPHIVDPDRVFRVHQLLPPDEGRDEPADPFARTIYQFYDWMATRAATLDGVAAYTSAPLPVGTGADARLAHGAMVSAGFWRTLGVRPVLGRFLLDDETHPATGARAVVLGHAFWRSRFGARADVVGQTLSVKGLPYEIVGVAPRGFRGVQLADVDVWLPLFALGDGSAEPVTWYRDGAWYTLRVVARLKPDVSVERASVELTNLQRAFLQETHAPILRDPARLERYRRARVLLGPLTRGLGDDLRPIPEARVTVWLVGVAFALVVVACSNIAGLLLLRAMRRRREIAVRLALGVSRGRLARQFLTESAVLALIGGLLALGAVAWGGPLLQRTILPAMAWEPSTLLDPAVLAVAGLATLAAAIVAGMAPLHYARSKVVPALRDGTFSASMRRPRMYPALLAVQGILSIVLLIGAGLFLRSLHKLETMDIGVDRDDVLAVEIDFSGTGHSQREVSAFFERAVARVSELPGIEGASLSLVAPLRGALGGGLAYVPGRAERISSPSGGGPSANVVAPGFFTTIGMRIVEGRDFVEAERTGARVAVVNETMARLGWPGRSPIGEIVCSSPARQQTCATVIGVVANAITFQLVGEETTPFYYTPLAPDAPSFDESRPRALLVRMAPDAGRMDGAIRQALLTLDPGLPYARIETLAEVLDPQLRPWRLGATVFTAFGLLAIALAMVGLWSSVSYAVSQRTNEFAIRMALGAGQTSLVRLVLGEGIRTATIATGAGLLIAAAASGVIADLLFEVSPRDPVVFGAIAAAVLVVATMASLLPAWRVTRVQPVDALRAE